MTPRSQAATIRNQPPNPDSLIHHEFPHTDETADREHLCARDELYQALREREADPIHVWVATKDDLAILKFGPCPHDGIIETGNPLIRFDLPGRGAVHFHPDCVPPNLQPIDGPA